MMKLYKFISARLFFNSIIRSFLEAYLKFSISTMIALDSISFNSKEGIINGSMALGLGLIVSLTPLLVYLFLKKYHKNLQEADFKPRFETLYLNVNTEIHNSILMMTLFIIRRLIFAMNIVFLNGYPVCQLYLQFLCCFMMLIFFILIKPLNMKYLNIMELFNEVTLLICSYYLFCFTSFIPDV